MLVAIIFRYRKLSSQCAAIPTVGVAARAAVAGGVATLYCAFRTLCKLSITLCKLFSPAWYLMLTMALWHIILYDLHFMLYDYALWFVFMICRYL